MNPKELRIVFMGTPEFAVPSLRALVAGGGTGDATIFLAEQLRHTDAQVVHLDMSSASIAIATHARGSGRPRHASAPRHSSKPAAKALAHSGRWAACGAITHAMTSSKNSVSRVSRGRAVSVWGRRMDKD